MNLSNIMKSWAEDKPLYKEFNDTAHNLLEKKLKEKAIFVRIISRVKDDLSLAKKLLRDKPDYEKYMSINDRAGIRVICKYREDLENIKDVIDANFDVVKYENKSSILALQEYGYKSLHFDVRIREDYLTEINRKGINTIIGEIQVRTLCEDVWAEIYHDLGYKPLRELPDNISRILYCLGGLLEVADTTFSNVNQEVSNIMELVPISALRILENEFLKIQPIEYDKELSLLTITHLLSILDLTYKEFSDAIIEFANKNNHKLNYLFRENASSDERPYLTQPEILLIYFLVERDPYKLISAWQNLFPIQDLQNLSTFWGQPIADLIEREK